MIRLINYIHKLLLLSLIFNLIVPNVAFAEEPEKVDASHKIVISFQKEDTINKVVATISSLDSASASVKDVEVKFYAKKSFGLLPLSEDAVSTDENGVATIDFPTDLPGDAQGNILVLVRLEDNEDLGDLQDMKTINWGIPKSPDNEFHTRALWASGANAPIPLVITVTSMVLGVWAVIFYIILQLFKIKKTASYEIKNQN
jgi:hypothetical protein